jgi:hypothetical protein
LPSLLEEICVFRKPSPLDPGRFELREKYLSEFDPFFVKFSKVDQEKALQNFVSWIDRLKARKSLQLRELVFPPKNALPVIEANYVEVLSLFSNDGIRELCLKVLVQDEFKGSMIALMVLRLLAIGLTESPRLSEATRTAFRDWFTKDDFVLLIQIQGFLKVSTSPFSTLLPKFAFWMLSQLSSLSSDVAFFLSNSSFSSLEEEEKDFSRQREFRKRSQQKTLDRFERRRLAFLDKFDTTRSRALKMRTSDRKVEFSKAGLAHMPEFSCIICRSEEDSSQIGLVSYISVSSVPRVFDPLHDRCLPLPSVFDSSVFRSCGHALHFTCFSQFMAGIIQQAQSGRYFEGSGLLNIHEGEFFCPLCKVRSTFLLTQVLDLF